MGRLVLAGLAVLGLGACATTAPSGGAKTEAPKTNHERWQGEWGVDVEQMIAMDRSTREQVAKNPQLVQTMRKMLGALVFRVGAESIRVTGPDGDESRANYVVKRQDGNLLVIDSRDVDKTEHEIIEIRFTDDDHLVMQQVNGPERIPMVRRGKASSR